MIVVGIFIKKGTEYKRLDLFADENISVTSSIQDANDISKTKTDFSQSFTVPANTNNNNIFQHWYDNRVDFGYDAKIRKDAYILLDTKVFRTGKIQLEKAVLKDNLPQSYTLTFFGSLVSLKDTFNSLYLKDLNSGTYDFAYSDAIVRAKVVSQTTDNIKFPLITSDKNWLYATINTLVGTINTSELFPAIRLKSIFNLIQSKFGIVFSGDFITTNAKFLNAYLLLKNSEIFKPNGQFKKVDFQTQTNGSTIGMVFNLTTDILNLTFDSRILNRTINWSITNTVANVNYSVYLFKDGVQFNKIDSTSIVGTQVLTIFQKSGNAVDLSNYEFYISSSTPLTFTSTASLRCTYEVEIPRLDTSEINQTTAQTTTSVLAVASYMPDQKIEDFFTGILKTFNLVCYSNLQNEYVIEQLETFYSQGNTLDITEYIISDNKSIERIKPYNKVNFQYEKSESVNNVKFLSNNGREFGSLAQGFDADGGDYSIKPPFENLSFSKLSGNLTAGYAIKTDGKAYIPKPVLLYDYGTLLTCPTFYLNGTTTTTYNNFGSETAINGSVYSLNFGNEISPITNGANDNSLYTQFYSSYLTNLYSNKSRIFKTSAILPISKLTSSSATCLKLNTKIIISGKRYVINSFNTNLITGVVELDLINDFRNAI